MMTFEDFEYILDKMRESNRQMEKLYDDFEWDIRNTKIDLTGIMIMVLEELFNDHENKWIDYFLYECNFGDNPLTVKLSMDSPSVVFNKKRLYQFLTENMKKGEVDED
jgi:hypothetical protein